eukprot:m.1226729 g.1226729  ORF g.1226729 m.1226729 type:complete len:96 (-) comp24639_c0_seq1:538-825(-)
MQRSREEVSVFRTVTCSEYDLDSFVFAALLSHLFSALFSLVYPLCIQWSFAVKITNAHLSIVVTQTPHAHRTISLIHEVLFDNVHPERTGCASNG